MDDGQPRDPNGRYSSYGYRPTGTNDIDWSASSAPLRLAGRTVPSTPVGSPIPDGWPLGKETRPFFRLDRTDEAVHAFHDLLAGLKRSGRRFSCCVDVRDPDDYRDMDLYVADDGAAGYAIADGDELVSVFARPGSHLGDAVVASAVDHGARRLDCYDIHGRLPALYARHGFRPVARVTWDDDLAPDDWSYRDCGRPDVMAMAITSMPPETVERTDYGSAVARAAALAGR